MCTGCRNLHWLKKTSLPTFRPSLCAQQHSAIWSIRKTQFAISTICKGCLHTKQHIHLCRAAAPLQSHSQRASRCSRQHLRAAWCRCLCVREYAILITFPRRLSADNTHSFGTAAEAVWRFHFLLSFLNSVYHKQAPPKKVSVFWINFSVETLSLILDTNSRYADSQSGNWTLLCVTNINENCCLVVGFLRQPVPSHLSRLL